MRFFSPFSSLFFEGEGGELMVAVGWTGVGWGGVHPTILFHSIPFYFIPFHSISFHFIPTASFLFKLSLRGGPGIPHQRPDDVQYCRNLKD
jgi:hypothetical protein